MKSKKAKLIKVKTLVVCRDADGNPDVYETVIELSQHDYDLGMHFDKAIEEAGATGYEEPMIACDEHEWLGRRLMMAKTMEFPRPPRIMVWVDKNGVQDVLSEIPLQYLVVSTDAEDFDDDCVMSLKFGDETHERVFTTTGTTEVNPEDVQSAWSQVDEAVNVE
jgi:hypothetical protein